MRGVVGKRGVQQACYLPAPILREIEAEAARQDRTIRWLLKRAWRIARAEIRRIPSVLPPQAKP